MSKTNFLFFILMINLFFFSSCSKKIIAEKPDLSRTQFHLDTLPESQINIPIQIYLKPIYSFAEKAVDTVFTSADWPEGWVQEGCDTRYRYIFRRGPLQIKTSGAVLGLGFTGYYKIIGSTRVCVNGVAISPWTPPCRCGFSEGERRVNVTFLNSFAILPNLKANLS